jgi:predicted RNA-binding protein with TRAM domain
MEFSDQLLCLFSEQIEQQDGSYVVEIPKRELQLGDLEEGRTYRVAMLAASIATKEEPDIDEVGESSPLEPPVEEGETCVVEIEGIGEQGDGIARVERGYVVIVPDTEKGERVRIEITDVTQNVAFAEVVERLSYYE